MTSLEIHFAPLQGYTDNAYRRLHARIYGGIDYYYTPFIRMEKGEPRHRDMSHLAAAYDSGCPTVPQIIFNCQEEFLLLSKAVKEIGFRRIDLNMGCPYPMQTGRGRGAAMIARTAILESIAEAMATDTETVFSLKIRTGMSDPGEWMTMLRVFDNVPLRHITMHPRTASQMYAGDMHTEEFGRFQSISRHRVVFNGNISSPAGIDAVASEFPRISGVMIGRGMLARPSMAAEWREGREWTQTERMSRLRDFHDALFDEYSHTLCGQTQILQKAKTFWDYLEPEIGHRAFKAIKKASSAHAYLKAVSEATR